jgi:hypothetical protein
MAVQTTAEPGGKGSVCQCQSGSSTSPDQVLPVIPKARRGHRVEKMVDSDPHMPRRGWGETEKCWGFLQTRFGPAYRGGDGADSHNSQFRRALSTRRHAANGPFVGLRPRELTKRPLAEARGRSVATDLPSSVWFRGVRGRDEAKSAVGSGKSVWRPQESTPSRVFLAAEVPGGIPSKSNEV